MTPPLTATEAIARLPLKQLTGGLSLPAQRRALHGGLVLSDAVMLGLAFLVAYIVRFHSGWPVFETDIAGNPDLYSCVVFLLIPVWLVLFAGFGLYRDQNLLGGTREYGIAFNAVSAGILVVVFATFLKTDFVIARAWLLLSWLMAFFFVAGARFWIRRVVYRLRTRGYFLAPAVIVGTNEEAVALAEQLQAWRTSGLHVLGWVGDRPPQAGERLRTLSVLGPVDDLEGIVDRYRVEEVIVATSAVTRADLVELFRRLTPRRGVELRLSSGLFEVVTTGLEIKELAYVPLINVRPARLSGADTVLKGVLDYGIALAVVALCWPLFLACALLVRADSPGPALHRRRVLGLGGREFDALKFRSMRVDGDAILAEHPELRRELAESEKLRDDPRVTRVGRWLRKTSLDELPQVLNVLARQMSVVGPRMITPEEHARYGQWDMNLLTVRPGITGLWQVSGRSDVPYAERVQLDMNYIRNWTIWLDLQILVQTVPAVLRGRGAY